MGRIERVHEVPTKSTDLIVNNFFYFSYYSRSFVGKLTGNIAHIKLSCCSSVWNLTLSKIMTVITLDLINFNPPRKTYIY